MKRVWVYLLAVLMLIFAFTAIATNESFIQALLAERGAAVAQYAMENTETCVMENNGTVNVTFRGVETDFSKIGPALEARVQELMELAKQTGAVRPEVQSMNYNVNNNYQWSGNVSLLIKPGEKAAAVATLLREKKYNVTFNVSAYRRCSYGAVRRQ